MSPAQSSVASRRRGFPSRWLMVLVVLAITVPAVGWSLWPGRSSAGVAPTLHAVERADFIHDITENGTIISGNNVEIRCEVKNNGLSGTTILEVVPEGSLVQKDDVLLRLDSSSLETDRTKQLIAVNSSKAEVIKGQVAYDVAVLAQKEYLEGPFQQEKVGVESEVFVARENLERAQEYVRFSERLGAKGYVTELQLRADRFAVKKAEKDLVAAQTKLRVLEEFTKVKTIAQLDAGVKTAEAHLKAQQSSNKLESDRLALIEDQIEKCVIRAPCAGQVVYNNQTNSWSGNKEVVIEAGSTVRERQVILYLPDREQIQVKARINESKIALVVPGMDATIRLDALPDVELDGTVEKVEEYPVPTNPFKSSAKEYETLIRVHRPDPRLRPGLTAEAKIHLERLPNVLQVPVETIVEHGDKYYCLFPDAGGIQPREVRIGATNDRFVIIRDGLAEGQEVVRNPAQFRDKVALPELPRVENRPAAARTAGATNGKPDGLRPDKRDPLRATNPTAIVGELLARYDKDGDGRLDPADLPVPYRTWADGADTNNDGALDRAELTAAVVRKLPPKLAARSATEGGS